MPIYTSAISFTNDFIQGVKQSYLTKDWKLFLEYFGSHYVYSVTYGARYIVSNTYS